jgi:LPXTG-motif cell wall-anchored protein
MSSETGKALGIISIYTGLLFFLLGMAAKWKSDFHSRAEISNAALFAAGIMAVLALVLFLLSWKRKQG